MTFYLNSLTFSLITFTFFWIIATFEIKSKYCDFFYHNSEFIFNLIITTYMERFVSSSIAFKEFYFFFFWQQ